MPLGEERYDLVIPAELWDHPSVVTLREIVSSQRFKDAVVTLGGYDVSQTGREARLG